MKVKDLVELLRNKVEMFIVENKKGEYNFFWDEEWNNAEVLEVKFYKDIFACNVVNLAHIYIK